MYCSNFILNLRTERLQVVSSLKSAQVLQAFSTIYYQTYLISTRDQLTQAMTRYRAGNNTESNWKEVASYFNNTFAASTIVSAAAIYDTNGYLLFFQSNDSSPYDSYNKDLFPISSDSPLVINQMYSAEGYLTSPKVNNSQYLMTITFPIMGNSSFFVDSAKLYGYISLITLTTSYRSIIEDTTGLENGGLMYFLGFIDKDLNLQTAEPPQNTTEPSHHRTQTIHKEEYEKASEETTEPTQQTGTANNNTYELLLPVTGQKYIEKSEQGPLDANSIPDLYDAIQQYDTGSILKTTVFNQTNVAVGYSKVGNGLVTWVVIISEPLSSVYAPVAKLRDACLASGFGVLGVLFVIVVFLINKGVQPIYRLKQAAEQTTEYFHGISPDEGKGSTLISPSNSSKHDHQQPAINEKSLLQIDKIESNKVKRSHLLRLFFKSVFFSDKRKLKKGSKSKKGLKTQNSSYEGKSTPKNSESSATSISSSDDNLKSNALKDSNYSHISSTNSPHSSATAASTSQSIIKKSRSANSMRKTSESTINKNNHPTSTVPEISLDDKQSKLEIKERLENRDSQVEQNDEENDEDTDEPTEDEKKRNEQCKTDHSHPMAPPHVNIKTPKYFTDELVSLQHSFNRMADELDKQYLHLEDMVRERTKELESARVQAEYANEAKSQFIATITHELRTPLNGILGMTAVSLNEAEIPKVKKNLQVISKSGEVLLHLINDLLTFSKNQVGNVTLDEREFMLSEIILSLQKTYSKRSNSKKNLSLQYHFEPSNLKNMVVLGDKGRITHVLTNIMLNSLKFAPNDTNISVSFRCIEFMGKIVNPTVPLEPRNGQINFIDTTCDDYLGGMSFTNASQTSSYFTDTGTSGAAVSAIGGDASVTPSATTSFTSDAVPPIFHSPESPRSFTSNANNFSLAGNEQSEITPLHSDTGSNISQFSSAISGNSNIGPENTHSKAHNPLTTYNQPQHCMFEFQVTDQGPGISESILDHVFEPFVQEDQALSRRYGGAGLGLSICKQLVELMGGNISLKNSPQNGLSVTFQIPLEITRSFAYTPDPGFVFAEIPGIALLTRKRESVALLPSTTLTKGTTQLTHSSSNGLVNNNVNDTRKDNALVPLSGSANVPTMTLSDPDGPDTSHVLNESHITAAATSLHGFKLPKQEGAKEAPQGSYFDHKPVASGPSNHTPNLTGVDYFRNGSSSHIDMPSPFMINTTESGSIPVTPGSTATISTIRTTTGAHNFPTMVGTPGPNPTNSYNGAFSNNGTPSTLSMTPTVNHSNTTTSMSTPSSIRILVAEDNLINQDIIRRMLRLEGIKDIDMAVNGEQAVLKIEDAIRLGVYYNIMFLDVQMPRMDGLQAARIIRNQLGYPYPIVALTAYADEDNARQCYDAGMNAFLEKPIMRERLKEVLIQYSPPGTFTHAYPTSSSIGTTTTPTGQETISATSTNE